MPRRARGELEAPVMDVLWARGEWMTRRDAQRAVSTARRPLMYTTPAGWLEPTLGSHA